MLCLRTDARCLFVERGIGVVLDMLEREFCVSGEGEEVQRLQEEEGGVAWGSRLPVYTFVPHSSHEHDSVEWVSQYDEAIAGMPVSNGSRFYEKSELKIGIVCDIFFYESIFAAAHFVPLHSGSWQETLEREAIDVLLFVTTWRGLDEEES